MNRFRNIYIVPVYNEEKSLPLFLESLDSTLCDEDIVIFIDDGSIDKSVCLIRSKMKRKYILLQNRKNMGLGHTLKKGFRHIIDKRFLCENIITLDSDHQHDFSDILYYIEKRNKDNTDVLLIRRDLLKYPFLKRLGNLILSVWATFLTGQKFMDVETGFRIFSLEALKSIFPYFRAYRYSCASEFAIISAMLGLKVDNRVVCNIRYYQSNTSYKDAMINFSVSFLTYLRMRRKV